MGQAAAVLAGGQLASNLLVGVMNKQAVDAATRQNDKLAQENAARNIELLRKQETEQTSDVVRKARSEIAAASVVMSGLGASPAMMARIAASLGGLAGQDKFRIAEGTKNRIDAVGLDLQQSLLASEVERTNAKNSLTATILSGGVAAAGTGYSETMAERRYNALEQQYRLRIGTSTNTEP